MILEGKVAMITGAATGIGQATAKLFAQEGAKIVIVDLKDDEANETVQKIKDAGGEAFYLHADLSKIANMEMAVKKAAETYGRLDIFFYNAGIVGPGFLENTNEADYDLCMSINLKAALFGSKYAAPEIKKAGGGSILFTSSGAGLRPSTASPTYCVSKAGLIMLARTLAQHLGKDNIRVNCLCPGIVQTPLYPEFFSRNPGVNFENASKILMERRAIQRIGTPEEIAHAALFLVSPQAFWITGVALPIDGGSAAA
jgi:NAD(P)-dependent dehydrogenase (short-subunit alcohol dehydrogenase family)